MASRSDSDSFPFIAKGRRAFGSVPPSRGCFTAPRKRDARWAVRLLHGEVGWRRSHAVASRGRSSRGTAWSYRKRGSPTGAGESKGKGSLGCNGEYEWFGDVPAGCGSGRSCCGTLLANGQRRWSGGVSDAARSDARFLNAPAKRAKQDRSSSWRASSKASGGGSDRLQDTNPPDAFAQEWPASI